MKLLAVGLIFGGALSGCVWVADDRPSRQVALDPVCGNAVDLSTPWRGRFRDEIYYFHSDLCRERFFSYPEAYAGGPHYRQGPRVYRNRVYHHDPVCGRDVAGTRWRTDYRGRQYYFHDRECQMEFQVRPQAYVGTYRREGRAYDAR